MQILITGGAGFIGSRLATALVGQGHEVILFDSLHPQVHHAPFVAPEGARFFAGDVRDGAAWDRVIAQHGAPDSVVHLAAETGTGQSLDEATRHASANVCGTTELTDALVRHEIRPQQLLLASSRAVYGEGAWRDSAGDVSYPGARTGDQLAAAAWDPVLPSGLDGVPVPHRTATTQARPTNVYAATKLAQEHILEAWCGSYGVPLSILRLQNVFGAGQAVGNAYTGVLTFFARRLTGGDPIDVYEDGDIVRDFVHVSDVVAALAAAVGAAPAGVRRLDIGSGAASTLIEVAETMSSIAEVEAPRITGQYRLGDVRAASADITDARGQLDWEPQMSLHDGLSELLAWVPSQL